MGSLLAISTNIPTDTSAVGGVFSFIFSVDAQR
jgi:hypothetical protein